MSDNAQSCAPRYLPISDYLVIGDMQTAVVISADGSIDWGCLPYFDSPAVFLRLLDWQKGGYCAVHVADLVDSSRRYLQGTNILETTFTTRSGSLVLTDFMPAPGTRGQRSSRVIRLLHCTAGYVDFRFDTKPTFSFASERSRISFCTPGVAAFEGDGQSLLVQGPALTIWEEERAVGAGRAAAGDVKLFALSCSRPAAHLDVLSLDEALSALEETKRYWSDWSARIRYQGDYREEMIRSALVLKMLTFQPTGAIVAAPTTSLPESMGGKRNWDYRFSWLRDSQFVLRALMHCGYFEEAHDFFRFLKSAVSGPADQLRVLYSIRGERIEGETELTYLDGYRGSRPVRVGNVAGGQKQNDIYGELLSCMLVYCQMAPSEAAKKTRAAEVWQLAQSMADHVVRHWREPDQGIWESRGAARDFVHSKAMCWAALDRAMRLASIANATCDIDPWRTEAGAILASVNVHGFNAKIGAFVQSYGSEVLDASVLRFPLQGVIKAEDPRMLSTIERIEQRLLRDGLLYRYSDGDEPAEEGAFTSCTLWLIDNYILLGRIKEARQVLGHLLSLNNSLGLFAEELEPETGDQLGNFPQALTHVALISAIRHLEGGPRPDAIQTFA